MGKKELGEGATSLWEASSGHQTFFPPYNSVIFIADQQAVEINSWMLLGFGWGTTTNSNSILSWLTSYG